MSHALIYLYPERTKKKNTKTARIPPLYTFCSLVSSRNSSLHTKEIPHVQSVLSVIEEINIIIGDHTN